jgi:hypothetical protein
VSDPLEPDAAQTLAGDTEEVDAVVVVSGAPAVVPVRRQALAAAPAVQAAAVAAGGFVAGAALVGLVNRTRGRDLVRAGSRRRGRRGGGRGRGNGGRAVGELVQIVGSRSLLVDVHLLGGRD